MLVVKSVKDHNDNPSKKKQNAEAKKRQLLKSSLIHKDKIDTTKDEPQMKLIKKNKDFFETSEHLNCTETTNEMELKEKPSKSSYLNINLKLQEPDSIKKKKLKLKSRMYINPKETQRDGDSKTDALIVKKKKFLNIINEEYKPGMLSNQLQIKKHDNLFFPWDSSFGLNPEYSVTKQEMGSDSENKNKKKLIKINPLFDLSKRQNENKAIAKNDSSLDTVFVGNLPTTTKIGDLKKLFRKCGVIRNAKLRHKEVKNKKLSNKDESNNDSKYINAKVKFTTVDSCQSALKMNGFLYKGHHVRVTLAGDEGKMSNPDKCVFVGNLAFKAQDDDLWKAFEDCGEIESVRVIRDEQSGKGKGFGYVNFQSADSVKMALKKDGHSILDRDIRVRNNCNNVQSLSDLITVKRKKLKKKKRIILLNNDNETTLTDVYNKTLNEEEEIEGLEHNEGKKKKKKKII